MKFFVMKTLTGLLAFMGMAILSHAQTSVPGSFVHGGITRTYNIYVPASYNASQPVPLVLNLHGYTSNAAQQEIYADFRPIADTARFILVHPNGSVQPGTAGTQFWNIGLTGSSVDDVSFLEALIDTVSAHYNINPSRVYSAGMSNGGFMGYMLACQSDRFAAVASVTGSMTTPLYACNPVRPVPVIEIHGTADGTVPYGGTTGMAPVADVVSFWVTKNNCSPTPVTTNVPDINTTDGATAEHYLYTGGTGGHTVEHFKVIGGGHTWPGAPFVIGVTCMDFSASREIWRFFSQYQYLGAGIAGYTQITWNIWPNPATEKVFVEVPGRQVTGLRILDMQGRTVQQTAGTDITSADVHTLHAGQYLVEIRGAGFVLHKKLSIP